VGSARWEGEGAAQRARGEYRTSTAEEVISGVRVMRQSQQKRARRHARGGMAAGKRWALGARRYARWQRTCLFRVAPRRARHAPPSALSR